MSSEEKKESTSVNESGSTSVTETRAFRWTPKEPKTPKMARIEPPGTTRDHRTRNMVAQRLRNYARQDKKMLRPSDQNITVDQALAKLDQNDIKCTYCGRALLLFAETKRHPDMWTLDRKENHIAHTETNVMNCCLKCNLKKRRQDTDKFSFAERLTHVVREGKDERAITEPRANALPN